MSKLDDIHNAFVRGYRLAMLREDGFTVDVPLHIHDMADTGDPCWCGSDNCEICIICGEQNHD